MRTKNRFVLLAAILLSLIIFRASAFALPAANDHTVLILDSTVSGGTSSREAVFAQAAGYDVEVVNGAIWGSKSASDFASYRALILGDATCVGYGGNTSPYLDAAVANKNVWGPVVTGNVVLVGTDPVYHQWSGGDSVTNGAVTFAAADEERTGAYIGLSCYNHGTAPTKPVT